MYTVSETIYFSYGHRLLDYQGKCAHLHGHNGRVEVILEAAALDGRSMVEDFDRIGAELRMLLRRDDPLVAPLVEAGEPLFLMDENPTAEVIARLVHEAARSIGLPVAEVRLWETEQSIASYRADR
jgi:6-pyruvoyltetrahydropterin/6-carboxytetrahydropterin synthase